jgi:SAM-dependent methyltransferase
MDMAYRFVRCISRLSRRKETRVDTIEQGERTSQPERTFTLRLPKQEADLDQSEEWFEVKIGDEWKRWKIHDYDRIFRVPGLYEALVYERLHCQSPQRVVDQLAETLDDWPMKPSDLRVLDLGAGNGIVGERLREWGASCVIGADILPEAAQAAERDRPDVYDDYIVGDITKLTDEQRERVVDAKLNCLVTVAALGFNDIPPEAFAAAFNLIAQPGWISLTLKEDFLTASGSGFSQLIRAMDREQIIDVQAVRRYLHRYSIGGRKLFYIALTARKLRHVPQQMVAMAADTAANTGDDDETVEERTMMTGLIG